MPLLLDKNLKGSLGENAKPLHNSHTQKPIRKKGPLCLRHGDAWAPLQTYCIRIWASHLFTSLHETLMLGSTLQRVPLWSSSNHSPLHEQGTWGPTGMRPPYLMSPLHIAMTLGFHALRTLVQFGSLCRLLPWSMARVDIVPYLGTPRPKVGQRLEWGKWGDACHRCITEGHQKLSNHDKH